eukprot:2758780-Pyramimonas_sp.AAC.1
MASFTIRMIAASVFEPVFISRKAAKGWQHELAGAQPPQSGDTGHFTVQSSQQPTISSDEADSRQPWSGSQLAHRLGTGATPNKPLNLLHNAAIELPNRR